MATSLSIPPGILSSGMIYQKSSANVAYLIKHPSIDKVTSEMDKEWILNEATINTIPGICCTHQSTRPHTTSFYQPSTIWCLSLLCVTPKPYKPTSLCISSVLGNPTDCYPPTLSMKDRKLIIAIDSLFFHVCLGFEDKSVHPSSEQLRF